MPHFSGELKSKLPKAGTTIFSVMTALANEHQAVNLAQGFPDFACDEALIRLVQQAMQNGHNQYAPMPGLMQLRERIAEKIQATYGAVYHPETEITVVPGGTLALFTAIQALVREGDEVIVIEPCYDSYVPAITLAGGRPVFVSLKQPDYTVDWNEVKKLVTFKTRMIIINTPHNPTGSVLSEADLKKLQKIVENTDIIVLSDEVYEHIIFDGLAHQSVTRYPALADRSLVVSSFGKTYHTTGWKMGYVVAPANLMAEFRKTYQFAMFSAFTPLQYALASYLAEPEHYLGLGAFYQHKRDLFRDLLQGSAFRILPCHGSYFQCLGYESITYEADKDFARRLTTQYKIASIPVSAFYQKGEDHHILRFCFAKKEETLEKAARILCQISA